MRMFRLWCMALCLVFAGASFASAHRVNIFAFVDGDAVQVECGFNRSQKVKQGTVEVFDATTGARLLQGTTDDNGVFRFPVTAELREAGHDLNLRIIAGEGHQNDWTVAADELASSGTPKAVAVAAAEVPATPASLSPDRPRLLPPLRLRRFPAARRPPRSSASSTPHWTPNCPPSNVCLRNRRKPVRTSGTSSGASAGFSG